MLEIAFFSFGRWKIIFHEVTRDELNFQTTIQFVKANILDVSFIILRNDV